ncbi:unnamed protein product [Vicia faba]|uniref:Uncharacterized protein n=1 Tax=Vicia faba TaxID=3906 RepID=A0AAV0Z783_VICFA|nr:unnamed protein product [Vicia faba]
MSAITFYGNEETLEIIQEKRPNLPRLKHHGLDLKRSMQLQSWIGYFTLLRDPIFIVLVKEFWKYAKISDDGNTILSEIFRLPIDVTISSIVRVTGCVSSGVTIDEYQSYLSIVERFRVLHDSSVSYEPTNPGTLLPSAKTWFRFSLSNLHPQATARRTLSHDDIIFVFLLIHHFKINLPKTILIRLKHAIEISRTQTQSYIPYGRILSEIMIQDKIWELIKNNGPDNALVEERCARDDIRQKRPKPGWISIEIITDTIEAEQDSNIDLKPEN